MLRTFMMAYEEPTLRGKYRLAMMAFGENNGEAGPKSVAAWCNCSLQEAGEIIDDLCYHGWLKVENGTVFQPQMRAEIEREMKPRREPRGTSNWSISRARRERLYERDGWACHYCQSRENLSLDHKVPQSKGGKHTSDNLVTCCRQCNSAKGVKDYDEFMAIIAGGCDVE